ncbi:hypothetical protein GCM10025868_42920 [Angustibacter aerolatus]|uniref:Uncharacterized protein n=1 Tax=Angustibacter aerolatus TaxID=1162965 RepID=A0ABQ6JQC0_9ACTN|nr:hypothetical protein [Angustibacter aerolatus]GMA89042.1 hypothetical protein GCM10025868_42920 [Angustibacter aerolatus]
MPLRDAVEGAAPEVLPEVVADVERAGLLPSRTHEQARNVVASPGGGPDAPDLRRTVQALDRGLCADPALASLGGRFLFGLDDGTGDVLSLRPDVAWSPDALFVDGRRVLAARAARADVPAQAAAARRGVRRRAR